jgi:hypothetical protein
MSKVRMMRSTPAVAMRLGRYLFQSWVRASLGWKAGEGRLEPRAAMGPGRLGSGEWIAMLETRWLEAEVGVRRSKIRRWESEETEERTEGEWGEKAVE